MTITDEGKQIRADVALLKPNKHRRYPQALKHRILDWVRRAMATGMPKSGCSKLVGIKSWRITLWLRETEMGSKMRVEPVSLVPIETPSMALSSGPVIVTPCGYRIEGLVLEQIAVLLRELS